MDTVELDRRNWRSLSLPNKFLLAINLFIHTALKFLDVFHCSYLRGRHHRPAAFQSRETQLEEASDVSLRRREFLEEYKEVYGYPNGPVSIDELRVKEFPQLNGTVYLDHAGATLYANSQLHAVMAELSKNLYGNPHSQNCSSDKSSNVVASTRQEVLSFFNAPAGEYSCIFTSGATAALKLVGETFPWSNSSNYFYTMENHNSVLGVREYALAEGATTTAVDVECLENDFCNDSMEGQHRFLKLRTPQKRTLQVASDKQNGSVYNLFALPLECNFSGAKFNLELVKCLQDGKYTNDPRAKWMVLLDAAKGCGTSPPDLSRYPIDFVAISFYKIFGYPTGLGALLVRNDAAKLLRKRYFGGGTVVVSVADVDFVQRRESVEQWLEDGTVSFLSIAALTHGFTAVKQLGLSAIERHVGSLTRFTVSKLASLRHCNGSPVAVIYGKHETINRHYHSYWGDSCEQGPVVAFNLMCSDGSWIGYHEVEKLAVLNNIHLRTGCFCNPGACSKYLKLSHEDFQANFEAGHVCWDDNDIVFGKPTGAVRVSFGYMSTVEDSLALIDFIRKFFVESNTHLKNTGFLGRANEISCNPRTEGDTRDSKECKAMYLESIVIYPIKSCGGFSKDAWPISDCGLLYDREWIIMSPSGDILTQKKYPKMCLIQTCIDLSAQKLHVTSLDMTQKLEIALEGGLQCDHSGGLQLCGQRPSGRDYGKEIAEWFTKALGIPCNLIRKEPRSRQVLSRMPRHLQTSVKEEGMELSFANEGQYLLVSTASVADLNQQLASTGSAKAGEAIFQVDAMRFRPNLVISGAFPHEEDQWKALLIGSEKFSVLGGCNRCQMVNIDPTTGSLQDANLPLLTLASYRRIEGKILFGILLVHDTSRSPSGGEISSVLQSKILKVGLPVLSVNT